MKILTIEEEAERLKARFAKVNRAEFARAHSLKGGQSMIYQNITGRRPISLDAALAYARGFGCTLDDISPRLAAEALQASRQTEAGSSGVIQREPIHVISTEIAIPQYDTGGSMGAGVLLRDQPGEINGWRVTPDWLQKNVRSHTGVKNLAIVTGFGDSMRGMFNPGDPLLVDRGINTFDGDAVYFFRVGDEGFIKRLQRIPGEGIIASSENKAYRDWTIKPDMDFQILARVIKVWQSVDF
ncbi:hypothetical protein CSZ94_17360 [Janthinobacterium sp. ROICE36]|uniref:LexA family transcriptional regulator n=1 Tax=Janthinobacterium sp. ROICE36 TaxID=2048670 RepID=UPI000C7F768F|nr:XRE family transcriptional regulator [Janthinobacterium sp. ROICE36]PLY41194.1 hypothetical protein CSZ94_17360 [Janthinobacterium sp. ROICE36]